MVEFGIAMAEAMEVGDGEETASCIVSSADKVPCQETSTSTNEACNSNSSASFHPNITTNTKITTSTPKLPPKKSKAKRDSTGLTESEKIVLERNAIIHQLTVKKINLEMEYVLAEHNAKMALIAKQSAQYD